MVKSIKFPAISSNGYASPGPNEPETAGAGPASVIEDTPIPAVRLPRVPV